MVYVVDVDIKGYFDSIPQGRLMALVRERIADGKVLGLVKTFLERGVLEEEHWTATEEGTPQGGVISPLLANIYLDPLDWKMDGLGSEMVRYADDMVVLCASREEAETALKEWRDWMGEAGLTLHPEKTRVVDLGPAGSHFDFLGYRFLRTKRGRLARLVRPKSLRKLRDTIRAKTLRTNGKCMRAIAADVNRTLRGWYAYFKHVNTHQMDEVDGWIRGRLRSILRKRRGGRGRERRSEHIRWPNRYFTDQGLFCLLDALRKESASLRYGVNH